MQVTVAIIFVVEKILSYNLINSYLNDRNAVACKTIYTKWPQTVYCTAAIRNIQNPTHLGIQG